MKPAMLMIVCLPSAEVRTATTDDAPDSAYTFFDSIGTPRKFVGKPTNNRSAETIFRHTAGDATRYCGLDVHIEGFWALY